MWRFQGGENNQTKLDDAPELKIILARILMCEGVRNDKIRKSVLRRYTHTEARQTKKKLIDT